ncbi:MAG: plasmid segregation protein ParM [Planctomycetaceae bacterium]|jgi:hypothetical protein|nr:plasmid segregation protein ParM [Planctomycetaceae bacterium]
MGSAANPTAKPITFFPTAVTPVTDDYKHVQIKILPGALTNSTKFNLKCTNNLEVVRGTRANDNDQTVTYDATPITDTTDLFPDDATNLYFVRAKNAGSGIDYVELYKVVNGEATKIDSAAFEVRQTLSGWIIPSGWKIANNTITTPMPVTTAFGPMTVGSGYYRSAYGGRNGDITPSNPKGEAFTQALFPNGFVLELTVSFNRNKSPNYTVDGQVYSFVDGYIQPDFKRDEQLKTQTRHQMDFIGNSGVRFCGKEIQIFDLRLLHSDFNVVQNDLVPVNNNWVIATKTINGIKYGYDGDVDRRVKIYNIITGNVYDDARIVPPQYTKDQAWQEYSDALVRQPNNSYDLVIDVTVNGNQLNIVTKLKGSPNTIFNNTVETKPNPYEYDKRVYLQAHWGSGVTFSSITINAK